MISSSPSSIRNRLQHHLDNLPVLPGVLTRLLALDLDRAEAFDEIRHLLEADPSFSSRLLVAANSAASAPRSPITTLGGAIARVGSRGTVNLVIALGVARVFVPRNAHERGLWRHAVQVAVMARALTRSAHPAFIDPEEAYTCGLLHDVGRFVLFQESPEELRKVEEADWETADQLAAAERTLCGLTHPELGSEACQRWGLPRLISEVVRLHHGKWNPAPQTPLERLVCVVQVADACMFTSVTGGAHGASASVADLAQRLAPKLPAGLALGADALRTLIETSEEEAQRLLDALGF